MDATSLAAYTANAAKSGTAAAGLVKQCQDTIDNPNDYTTRGGSDGNYWPQSAVACAFAYVATQKATYLTQALLYWKASLSDDQKIGDGAGCKQGVSTAWQSWASAGANPPAPAVLLTITHDTGYPIRWYGPDIALTYDWLYSAAGVDPALQAQTVTCLGAWVDYYSQYGYHHDEAGANYNAGYVISKALAAIAIGTDGGADGHLWTQAIDTDFTKLLVGQGLSGASGGVGTPAGPMVGGGWGEGWEYGALSVLEYAAATRALEDYGASLPAMDDWSSSLFLRNFYATTPDGKFEFCGDGDCDIATPNKTLNPNELDAVLVGTSSAQAAGWAASAKRTQGAGAGDYVYNALAEARATTPASYTAQTPAPPLWYLAHGTREVYAHTSWDATAFWGVFASPPQINSDHQHFVASNLVFSRGADDLVVDGAPYGLPGTLSSNAVTVDSSAVGGDYAPSQTPWSTADLPWARGTSDATYAARSDFANAFIFSSNPSDVTYAHREWVMLPEGEVVTVDRAHTSAASRNMYVRFHTNTGGGGLKLAGSVATGTAGGSQLAIHAVMLSGGTPSVTTPADCSSNTTDACCQETCSYPCGTCDVSRFAVDEYRVTVPGPWAVAIHAIDGLGSSEQAATVDSMNDATIDPGKQNGGVVGAAVYRATKQSYVVASSAQDGASPTTMTYGVPGGSAGRHIVFDAPEASDGTSTVTAAAQSGRCVVTITAGSGKGYTGHPLMFQVGDASGGCVTTDSTNVPSGNPPPGGGVDGGTGSSSGAGSSSGGASSSGGSGSGGSGGGGDGGASSSGGGGANGAQPGGSSGGCGCGVVGQPASGGVLALGGLAVWALARRRRRTLR
jgi:MYXO-CTERM domain-containing protein